MNILNQYTLIDVNEPNPSAKMLSNRYALPNKGTIIAGTDPGYHYKSWNEDLIIIDPSGFMAIVDGMGGVGPEGAGRLASLSIHESLINSLDYSSLSLCHESCLERIRFTKGDVCMVMIRPISLNDKSLWDIGIIGDCKLIILNSKGNLKFDSDLFSAGDSFELITQQVSNFTEDCLMNYFNHRHFVQHSFLSGDGFYCTQARESGDVIMMMSDGVSDNISTKELISIYHYCSTHNKDMFDTLSHILSVRQKACYYMTRSGSTNNDIVIQEDIDFGRQFGLAQSLNYSHTHYKNFQTDGGNFQN